MDKIIGFLNEFEDWEQRLYVDYAIKTKWDENHKYFLLKYSQLESPFSEELVRQCRGSIFRYDCLEEKYICVCAPFYKFANYGEDYAADIDWKSADVSEKIDGSLMKVWFDQEEWHLSTNGTIDAYKAEVGDTGENFGSLFERASGFSFEKFCRRLEKGYTYMYELVSPESRVVIGYSDKVYFLSRRSHYTWEEDPTNIGGTDEPKILLMSYIKDKVFDVAEDQDEGVVVCDKCYNRIKIKSTEYKYAARLANNGAIGVSRIIQMIKESSVDDFLYYHPHYASKVAEVQDKIIKVAKRYEEEWEKLLPFTGSRAAFAKAGAAGSSAKHYLFKKLDNSEVQAIDVLLGTPTKQLRDLLLKEGL